MGGRKERKGWRDGQTDGCLKRGKLAPPIACYGEDLVGYKELEFGRSSFPLTEVTSISGEQKELTALAGPQAQLASSPPSTGVPRRRHLLTADACRTGPKEWAPLCPPASAPCFGCHGSQCKANRKLGNRIKCQQSRNQ